MLPGEIDLGAKAVASRVGIGVVVVVPALAEGERRDPPVVLGAVTAVVGNAAPKVGGRIHQPGAVVHNDQAQGDAPEHQGPATSARGGADPKQQGR